MLLAAYALGAATSLALATLAGGRVLAALKGSLGAGEWVRRALGAAVLAAVAAIALGFDTGALASWSTRGTQRLEQSLLDALPGGAPALRAAGELAGDGALPSLDGATLWLNSPPLTRERAARQGRPRRLLDLLVHQLPARAAVREGVGRALPRPRARRARRARARVRVREGRGQRPPRRRRARRPYPVALDNDFAIWRAFDNHSWPAHYFVDAEGRIRGHHFGEGEYAASEQRIRALLMEAGQRDLPPAIAEVEADGVARAADFERVASPETYIGYRRAERFVSPSGLARDAAQAYALPAGPLARNDWALAGRFTVSKERAVAEDAGGAHRVPVPRARSPPRARAGAGRPARALPRDDRRQASRGGRGDRRRRERSGRRARAAALPADPSGRAMVPIAPSRSSSSMPARRRTPSRSADPEVFP